MTTTPARLHHVAVQVADLARAEAFYAGVLGLPVVKRWPGAPGEGDEGGERSIWVGLGDGAFLALERCAGAPSPEPFRSPRAGLHLVALAIPLAERDAWEARLAAHGVAVVHRTDFTLYALDPEGNRVALSHYPKAMAR